MAETNQTQQLLAGRMAAREEPPVPLHAPTLADAPSTLDEAHTEMLRVLLNRHSWRSAEFHHEAKSLGLMPYAALKRLNEWALLHHGDLLTEGEHTITINPQLVNKI